MNANTSTSKSPLAFFLLELALSIPTWVVMGAWPQSQLFPFIGIPLSAIWAPTPVIAALILVHRENKTASLIELLKRGFDAKRIKSKAWLVPMMLLWPGIVFIQYGLGFFSGMHLPPPQLSFAVPLMFVGTFCWSLGEELGWTGYARDPMQERYGAFKASMLLGLVWAGLHVPIFVLGSRSPG